MWWTKTSGSLHDNTEVQYLLTRFDLLDHRSAVAVLHLSYVQQGVRVTVVGGPVVHEDPGAAAAAVHHDPIIQSRVQDICGLHGLCNGEVPGEEQNSELKLEPKRNDQTHRATGFIRPPWIFPKMLSPSEQTVVTALITATSHRRFRSDSLHDVALCSGQHFRLCALFLSHFVENSFL